MPPTKRKKQVAVETETATSVATKTSVMTLMLAGLVAAAAFGFVGYQTYRTGSSGPVVPMPGDFPPAYNIPVKAPPAYYPPAYLPSGALTASACALTGWQATGNTVPIANIAKSSVIKGLNEAVYWYGADGKRYVFPNVQTYRTWFPKDAPCPTIQLVTDQDLASVMIGGNVTYRPGVRLMKISADPKIYAVAKNGVARWVTTPALLQALYGANWKSSVDVMPDAFFVNYAAGTDIKKAADYSPAKETAAALTIDVDKGL